MCVEVCFVYREIQNMILKVMELISTKCSWPVHELLQSGSGNDLII